jgi:L-amino acid N-acyltransferase YncA
MPQPFAQLRAVTEADFEAMTAIYSHHVRHGTGTFETTPPSHSEMLKRWADVRDKSLPWLCAERDGRVMGFAYANWFRPREAFRFCAEDSVYIAPEAIGQGLGRALLGELMQQCEAAGIRKMVAVVGDSANTHSIGLHQAMGFTCTTTLVSCGWKFDRWLDIVILERWLGTGDRTPPPTLQP